jgi:hypothetical protein
MLKKQKCFIRGNKINFANSQKNKLKKVEQIGHSNNTPTAGQTTAIASTHKDDEIKCEK